MVLGWFKAPWVSSKKQHAVDPWDVHPGGCWGMATGNWQLLGENWCPCSVASSPHVTVYRQPHISRERFPLTLSDDNVSKLLQDSWNILSIEQLFVLLHHYLLFNLFNHHFKSGVELNPNKKTCDLGAFVIFVAPPVLQAHLSLQAGRNATGPRCRSRGISHLPGTQMVNLPWEIRWSSQL